MDIREIYWGEDSAELDKNLLSYFIDSPELKILSKKRKNLIVGRKGTGKSAIRKKLAEMLRDSMNIEIMPNKNVMESICNDRNIQNNFDNEIFFQYAWLTYLYDKIFEKIDESYQVEKSKENHDFIKKYIETRHRYNNSLVEAITNIIKSIEIESGRISDLGLTIEKELIKITSCDIMENSIKSIVKDEQEIVIFIDDLDLGWDNSSISNNLLLGLLYATSHIHTLSRNIHTFIFIRDDMYKILMSMTQHSDKYRDVSYIKWDMPRLEKLLIERIVFNYKDNELDVPGNPFIEVFEECIGKTNTMKWMYERTLNRPRELLQLCRMYTESLESSKPNAEAMKEVEELYSQWKLQDLCNEFKNKYPELDNFFDVWKRELYRIKYHLKYDELLETLKSVTSKCDIEENWYKSIKENENWNNLVDILYEIGFIGDFIKGGDGGSKVIYSDNHSHKPKFEEVQIHNCFRKTIGTVQRIR